jgi:hypothetical protein
MAAAVQEGLERQTGKKLTVVCLGKLECHCPRCERARKAPWN